MGREIMLEYSRVGLFTRYISFAPRFRCNIIQGNLCVVDGVNGRRKRRRLVIYSCLGSDLALYEWQLSVFWLVCGI